MFKSILATSTLAVFCLVHAGTATAQVSSWSEGIDTDFGDANNWTNGVPDDQTIASIGPGQDAQNGFVFLDDDREVGGLLITDGMVVANSNHRLTVNNVNAGGLSIAGGNIVNDNNFRPSELYIFGANDASQDLIVNGTMRILDRAQLQLFNNGLVQANGDTVVDSDSTIRGDGSVNFGNNAFNNNGMLFARNGDTLWLRSADGNTVTGMDIDGDQEAGFIRATDGGTVGVSGKFADAFDGNVEIGADSTVHFDSLNAQFGAANVQFDGEEDSASTLSFSGTSNMLTGGQGGFRLNANGHGLVVGSENVDGVASINGFARIEVEENRSLVFGPDKTQLQANLNGGRWEIENNGVLDFKDTLVGAESVSVQLNGGTIKGEGSGALRASDEDAVRGHGRFELPLINEFFISAEGGTLFVDATSDLADLDGTNDTGRWWATQGDLHIKGSGGMTMNGEVRVGPGRELFVEDSVNTYSGNVQLNRATLRSNETQFFIGSMDVVESSTIESRASFQQGVAVNLEGDLNLKGNNALFITSSFSGEGDVVVEDDAHLFLTEFADINVDLVNHGKLSLSDFNVLVDGDIDNLGEIIFDIEGSEVGQYEHLDLTGTLFADDALFTVLLEDDFDPMAGNEFDLIDFASFVDMGYEWSLPSLDSGLAWDTSDFGNSGVISVVSSVPEPAIANLALLAVGLAFVGRRRD